MPFGFKLETEENVLKSIELAKNLDKKKQKIIQKNSEYSKRSAKNDNSDLYSIENSYHSNKKSLRDRKPTTREDLGYVDKSLKGKSAAAKIIQRKCEKGLIKIKNNPNGQFFYLSKNPGEPSLSVIERNIRNFTYNDLSEFLVDLRKLWSYYFEHFYSNPEIYQKTCKMSEYCEEVYNELQSQVESKNDISELSKKVESIEKNLKDLKESQSIGGASKKIDRNSNMDRMMTYEEKNELGKNIRNLSREDLKGIIEIMRDSSSVDNQQKFFEFDLDRLPVRKLRELERYVSNCNRNKPKIQPQIHQKSNEPKPSAIPTTQAPTNQKKDDLDSISSSESESSLSSELDK